MQRSLPQRIYSGAVRGEVVIQGDLSAQGDINTVNPVFPGTSAIDGARTAYRTVTESPDTFGSMHKQVQDSIKSLLAVSELTSQYLGEGRLDDSVELELAQLSQECRHHLVELENALRQDDVSKFTDILDAKARTFEEINSRVNTSLLQVEKALKKYITQVKAAERASSIRTTISSASTSSALNREEWRQIQQELESVGITVARFNTNRAKILRILSDAFKDDLEVEPPVRIKKANQLHQILSLRSSKDKNLLAAAHEGNVEKAKTLLRKGAYIETQDTHGFTLLSLALFLSYKADVNKKARPEQMSQSPLIRGLEDGSTDLVKLLLNHGAEIDLHTLWITIEQKKTEYLRLLLSYRPKVDLSSLVGAASASGNEGALRLLIDKGVDVNGSTEGPWLPTKRPLDDSNQRTNIGTGKETPVWLAAAAGHRKSLDLLLAKGALIEKLIDPLVWCLDAVHTEGECLFWREDVTACTALQIAVSHRHWECARLLVSRGGDLNARIGGPKGMPENLLHLMIRRHGRQDGVERVRILVELGVDVNWKIRWNETPLHFTFRAPGTSSIDSRVCLELVLILVVAGTKVDVPDGKAEQRSTLLSAKERVKEGSGPST
ncbi:MAG: hypothetical protein Q9207_007999 [Kuettlingeria erythrocarpa]